MTTGATVVVAGGGAVVGVTAVVGGEVVVAFVAGFGLELAGVVVGAVLGSTHPAMAQEAKPPPVNVIEVSGYLDGVEVDFITKALGEADRDGAQALVIQLNSALSSFSEPVPPRLGWFQASGNSSAMPCAWSRDMSVTRAANTGWPRSSAMASICFPSPPWPWPGIGRSRPA